MILSKIKTKIESDATMERIEELCPLVQDCIPKNDRYLIELDLSTSLIEEYEEEYYPISTPSLIEVIKLRMLEMGKLNIDASIVLGV